MKDRWGRNNHVLVLPSQPTGSASKPDTMPLTSRDLTETLFAIPGDIASPTGGYAYDRRVLALLPAYGLPVRHVALPARYPSPTPADLDATRKVLASAPADATLLIDGLAYGAMPEHVINGLGHRIVALVHHPLCLESGLSETRRRELATLERRALAMAAHVIVTSRSTGRIIAADFAVPAEKISVAEPGTDPAPRSTGTGTPLQLLAVGAVSRRKSYDTLVRALAPLAAFDWRLTIAGAVDRDPGAVADLAGIITDTGLSERIVLAGTVVPATLDRFYASADLFLMPSLFEGYGMALAEAMARGLPIVCTSGGAAAETVPDAAAIKVAPGDVEALTRALRTAIAERRVRTRLADASWEAGRALPTWNETARRIAAAILGVPA